MWAEKKKQNKKVNSKNKNDKMDMCNYWKR